MTKYQLTRKVKKFVLDNGADLVGIAPVSRWEKAPIKHSPKGIMPESKSVIVAGVHFLDANTELAAEKDPRFPGPGYSEMNASVFLQSLGFKIAKFLQDMGFSTIPIIHTMLWNYRPQEGAERGWMADMCHYYAAVCAGLGEIGWNNLCLTPQFGPRQRFISIITEAELEPDPLYNGEPLCDKCLLCAKNCPTESFDKEVIRIATIEIEDKKFSFPYRNLWRCAIGENFQLDVFIPKPEKIDENFILETIDRGIKEKPEVFYGWKMGMCLKYCVPPKRRYFDRNYCKSPRRKRDKEPDFSEENVKKLIKEIKKLALKLDVDIIGAASIEEFKESGINLNQFLPDAKSALILGFSYPENCSLNTWFTAEVAELLIAKHIQEKYGFSSLIKSGIDDEKCMKICNLTYYSKGITFSEKNKILRTIITQAPFNKNSFKSTKKREKKKTLSTSSLTEYIKTFSLKNGADLVGITCVEKLDEIAEQLKNIYENEKYFIVENKGWVCDGKIIKDLMHAPFNPVVKEVKLIPRKPSDYLKSARSIIVIGLHLIEKSIELAGSPPGYKAGHYMYTTHMESINQIFTILKKITRELSSFGYQCIPVIDIFDISSKIYGEIPDLYSSRFAAIASGLGEIGWNGIVLTPQFGPRQRFACIITDAELIPDSVYKGPSLCKKCYECVNACPVSAISEKDKNFIKIDGKVFEWGKLNILRCDCAKRYALIADEGPKYIGSKNNFKLPEKITPEFVCEALKKSDRIQEPGYCTIVENCFKICNGRKK
ncbi:MAG TPA: 4Fe-4S binding protein [bacterium]|nr:4Fe-4S binding protein [bacterium]HOM26074.1 4Fe-4S binding protein [bacterium]